MTQLDSTWHIISHPHKERPPTRTSQTEAAREEITYIRDLVSSSPPALPPPHRLSSPPNNKSESHAAQPDLKITI